MIYQTPFASDHLMIKLLLGSLSFDVFQTCIFSSRGKAKMRHLTQMANIFKSQFCTSTKGVCSNEAVLSAVAVIYDEDSSSTHDGTMKLNKSA